MRSFPVGRWYVVRPRKSSSIPNLARWPLFWLSPGTSYQESLDGEQHFRRQSCHLVPDLFAVGTRPHQTTMRSLLSGTGLNGMNIGPAPNCLRTSLRLANSWRSGLLGRRTQPCLGRISLMTTLIICHQIIPSCDLLKSRDCRS
jgi:hypothetical protein